MSCILATTRESFELERLHLRLYAADLLLLTPSRPAPIEYLGDFLLKGACMKVRHEGSLLAERG